MKKRLFTAAIAAGLIAAFAQSSYALPITFTDTTTLPPGVVTPANGGSTGNYVVSFAGSITNQSLSPFGDTTTPYSVLGAGPAVPSSTGSPNGSATFDYTAGISSWSFIWGSPDLHNTITFLGTNGLDESFTGSILGGTGTGAFFVTFSSIPTGDLITSVILSNNTKAAFEFDNVTPTPLPAALPLFASALGIGGIFLRSRKKKAAKSQVAFA
jgi:hypothetical protein